MLSGCERTQQVIQPVTTAESLGGEIRIGVVLPRTGDLGPGEFGPGALVMENSFNMALEEINASQRLGDRTLKFIIEDDMSTVDGAVRTFNKLIHNKTHLSRTEYSLLFFSPFEDVTLFVSCAATRGLLHPFSRR